MLVPIKAVGGLLKGMLKTEVKFGSIVGVCVVVEEEGSAVVIGEDDEEGVVNDIEGVDSEDIKRSLEDIVDGTDGGGIYVEGEFRVELGTNTDVATFEDRIVLGVGGGGRGCSLLGLGMLVVCGNCGCCVVATTGGRGAADVATLAWLCSRVVPYRPAPPPYPVLICALGQRTWTPFPSINC